MPTLLENDLWSPEATDFFHLAPELAWVGVLCLLMIGPLVAGRRARTVGSIALVGIGIIGWCVYLVGREVADGGVSAMAPPEAAGMFVVDNLSIFFKGVLLVFLAGVTLLWWQTSADREPDAPEFFVLLFGSALGMALMVSTQNLLMMVVAIEFASLPSYAMVGFDKKNRLAAEAALKYVVFGGVCAAIMLYGVSLIYGYFGTLDFAVIALDVVDVLSTPGPERLIVGLGLFCVFAGIAFKISAVPFHFWCPDAFQGARTEVTTWLSVASKAAGLLLLLRFVHIFGMNLTGDMLVAPAWILGIVATITCTVGNLAAYWQTSVKRMLAYSSIAHAGYMMMAAAIFVNPASTETFPAIGAILAYIVVYMFMNLGAFGVVALLQSRNGGDDSLAAFSGLARRSLALAIPMLFCLVSLVGLPPFAGFLVKYYLLSALFDAQGFLFIGLIVAAVVNTLLSLWYYMRVVVQMMLRDDGQPAFDAPPGGALLVNVCGVLLLVMLVFGGPLKRQADRFAGKLFNAQPAVYAQTITPEPAPALAASAPD